MSNKTKQARHTPGPWDLRDTIFGDAVYEVTAGSSPPATVGWAARKKDEGEAEANARLSPPHQSC